MSIVAFAAWLFVLVVLAPIVLGLVRIFFPWIVGTVIAALYAVPIILMLMFAVFVIGSCLQPRPAQQRYQPVSDDTLRRLDELYKDPSFRHNVGLPTVSVDVTPNTVPTETPAPRAELVNTIPVTGQSPSLEEQKSKMSEEWLQQQMAKWPTTIPVTGQP